MPAAKIFISQEIPQEGLILLQQAGIAYEIWGEQERPNKAQLIRSCSEMQGLISMVTDPIDGEFLRSSRHLKILSQYGVGLNNIDLPTAATLGIPITNTPDVLTNATAELTIALMMASARNFKLAMQDLRQGKFKHWAPCDYRGKSLRGKVLGIFGLGRIGMAVARIAHDGLGMRVLYHSRSEKKFLGKAFAQAVSWRELLAQSDILSVHCDLNETSRGIFDRTAFLAMKQDAIFINTSRGAVHCADDLYLALKENKLMGAGLDVTDPEPLPKNHPAWQLSNLLILPHIGSATYEARKEMAILACKNIATALS